MRRTENGKKNKIKYILVSIVAVLLIAAILVVAILDSKYGIFEGDAWNDGEIEYDGEVYVKRNGIETFLVMGLDKMADDIENNSYNNDQQADFLMLLVFDSFNKIYSAVQINRDTIVEMDTIGADGHTVVGSIKKQIALSHTYGDGGTVSSKNVARAVSRLFNEAKVNYYASVTLDAVGVINDLVGGVTLEVLDDFSDVDEDLGLVKGETVTLNAKQALAYVQSRKDVGDSTNESRMKRQQQYLEALQKQVEKRSEEDPEFLGNLFIDIFRGEVNNESDTENEAKPDFIVTDAESRFETFGERMKEYEFKGIKTLEGESKVVNNFMEFHIDQDDLTKMTIELFYKVKK